MTLADYDYELPPSAIAQYPASERSASRMLVLNRQSGQIDLRSFADFPEYLKPGDCLVLNDSKVIPARMFGVKQVTQGAGARVEVLLLEEINPGLWEALLRPGSRMKPGTKVTIVGDDRLSFQVQEKLPDGAFIIAFSIDDINSRLSRIGSVPLPPYIQRTAETNDRDRYQTVYARHPGSVAAPTAGLHFTLATLERLRARGVRIVYVTLHIGLGTFKPVTAERIEDHPIHSERYALSAETAVTVNQTRAEGNAVVAVGTSTVRVLESCVSAHGELISGAGRTSLFLFPPYQMRVVSKLLTNFHLPKSTLLMLVCAFASRERVFAAYRQAIAAGLRFYSYGDCMLIV